MGYVKRILLPVALCIGVAVGIAAGLIYQPRLAELFVGEMPQMIVPAAMGVAILWRTGRLEQRLNGRMDELKEGYVAAGVVKGLAKGAELAREDRAEFKEALLTPVVPPPDPEPPKKGK